MEGLKFDNTHTYNDYGLVLTSKTIGTPTPKTNIVDIPGANGQLDLTEYLGEVTYKNRVLSFTFEIVKKQDDYYNLVFTKLQNELHGKIKKIILDIDKDFYYIGRVYINEWKSNKKIGNIVIEVDAEPYKYKLNTTNRSFTIDDTGSLTVIMDNLRMPTVPTFTVSSEVIIEFDNSSYSISNSGIFEDIVLKEGKNILTFKGTSGTEIAVSYQEGSL